MDLRSAAPWGLFDVADPDEFRRRYRHRLHRYAPRILDQLGELRACYPDVVLVLMCFERDRSNCHPLQLAEWLTDRLGVEVPEIGTETTLWRLTAGPGLSDPAVTVPVTDRRQAQES